MSYTTNSEWNHLYIIVICNSNCLSVIFQKKKNKLSKDSWILPGRKNSINFSVYASIREMHICCVYYIL